jgi:hypothetical protein
MLELALRSRELFGGALAVPVELLLLLAHPVDDRVAPIRALSRASGSADECCRARAARSGGGAGSGSRRGVRVRARRAVGEVEARLEAGAAASDVAPLLQRAAVGEEDIGAVDGHTLGGMAGERVAVVEVFAGVRERNPPDPAALVGDDQRVVFEADNGAAHAVAEPEPAVVAAAEDLLADPELALAGSDRAAAEPMLVEHARVRGLVQLVHV